MRIIFQLHSVHFQYIFIDTTIGQYIKVSSNPFRINRSETSIMQSVKNKMKNKYKQYKKKQLWLINKKISIPMNFYSAFLYK